MGVISFIHFFVRLEASPLHSTTLQCHQSVSLSLPTSIQSAIKVHNLFPPPKLLRGLPETFFLSNCPLHGLQALATLNALVGP